MNQYKVYLENNETAMLGEYLQIVNFLRRQQHAMPDTLKQHFEKFNQEAYQKYSIEELLKENTSKKG